MKILVINSGSSSLKFQLYNSDGYKVLISGICERIGLHESFYKYEMDGKKEKVSAELKDHKVAIKIVLDVLVSSGAVSSLDEIGAIGHRTVHGGEYFNKSVLVTKDVKDKIRELIDLAPLHNGPNLLGIEVCEELLSVPNVAVFDTAFHQTIKKDKFLYPLPYKDYDEFGVRKYGFHGTSFKYLSSVIEEKYGKDLKVVIAHLGNGCSISAIKGTTCVDTSMGLTPLDGLLMGTRCGNIDPSTVTYLMEKRGLNAKEMNNYLNKKSGILGLLETSSDMRDVESGIGKNGGRSELIVSMIAYKIKHYLGSYFAQLNGLDILCFTAGVGENCSLVRDAVCKDLEALGIELDEKANENNSEVISTKNSKVKVLVIPTDEEYVIAKDVFDIVNG